MAKRFKVVIVTPDKTAYEGEAVSATLPGQEGYLGVWADHAALVSAVVPGLVSLKLDDAGNESFFAVGAGFVEISDNVVNLMTETCEDSGDIDAERARHALDRARERLTGMDATLDRERARLSKARAEARIRASERGK